MVLKRLVLSGGSLKGVSYIGVLKALEEHNLTNNINDLVGTSIGAFFCLLIVLGYTSNDLLNIFGNINFSSILEYKLSNLISSYGLDDGIKLEKFIQIFIKNRNIKVNITMSELFKLTGKNLVFVSCCVNTKSSVYINHITFPELPVFLGARMSMNIPIIFSPVVYKGDYYTDGCFTDNLPVKYLNYSSDKTLVVFLKDNKYCRKEILDIKDYLTMIPKCSFNSIEETCINYCNDVLKCEILKLNIYLEDTINFKISEKEKIEFVKVGYQQTKQWISRNL